MGPSTRRRLAAVTALATATVLSGCWPQVGAGPDGRRHNPYEQGITAANVATLEERWTVTGPGFISEPILGGGRVHYLRRVEGDLRSGAVETLDAVTGRTLWEKVLLPPTATPTVLSTDVTTSGGHLWVGLVHTAGGGLFRLDPATGAEVGVESEIVLSPVVTGDGVVAYLRVTADLHHQQMVVRDATTLARLWTGDHYRRENPTILVRDGLLHFVDGQLSAYAAAGCGPGFCSPLWRTDVDTLVLAAAAAPGGRLVTVDRDAQGATRLVLRDAATGTVLWAADAAGAAGGIAVDDRHAYVPTADALVAFDLDGCGAATCPPAWAAPLPGRPATPLVGGGVVYTSAGDDLHALGTDGAPLAVVPGVGTPRSLGEGRLYTTTVDPAAGTTTLRALAPG